MRYGRANRLSRTHFIEAGECFGLRQRATANVIDALVDAAQVWPERCDQIGFDDRQTERLAQMLRTRIDSLKKRESTA
jgi:serine/threonine-protein kinase HipA